MKNKINRLLKILLSLIIAFSMLATLSINAKAASKYTYTVNDDNTLTITGYTGNQNGVDIVIPSTIDGKKVVAIGDGAFKYSLANSITMSDTIKSVGEQSFYGIEGNVYLSANLEEISSLAFGFSTLGDGKEVTLPKSLKVISNFTFVHCNKIIIPEGATTIADNAFNFSESLYEIDIPSTITSIGKYAIGYYGDEDRTDVTCYVYPNSVAEKYCKEKNVKYVLKTGIPFTDVAKGKWYYSTVQEAYQLGLMTGTDSTHFSPSSPMTRGMIATVLYRMAGSPSTKYESIFSDVPSGKYYSTAVTWAYKNNIVSGYSNGKFGPGDNITRQDVAVILYNYAKKTGIDLTKKDNLSTFKDTSKVSSYASTAMKWAVGNGILSGTSDGKLNPKSQATRAECAKMILQFYKLIKE